MTEEQIKQFKEEYGIPDESDAVVDDEDYEESYEVNESWVMKK